MYYMTKPKITSNEMYKGLLSNLYESWFIP